MKFMIKHNLPLVRGGSLWQYRSVPPAAIMVTPLPPKCKPQNCHWSEGLRVCWWTVSSFVFLCLLGLGSQRPRRGPPVRCIAEVRSQVKLDFSLEISPTHPLIYRGGATRAKCGLSFQHHSLLSRPK